jgi:murein DD-endopeptidase MepM/ murein hydrolase activator NlpD
VRRVLAIASLVMLAALAAVASAASGRSGEPAAVAVPPAPAAAPARAEYIAPTGPADPAGRDDPAVMRRPRVVRELLVPIAGRAIPTDPLLLPNSQRAYRAGVHEGIDLAAAPGTPVLAAADGVIVRIDHDFSDVPTAQRDAALFAARKLGYTPEATLDLVRGRQVWIDHGHGVVTRYCHLSSVGALPVGAVVHAGEQIGSVGSSGLPEGGPHLHFEVRLGDDYLGDGLDGPALLRTIDLAFR